MKDIDFMISIFSGSSRKGIWTPPRMLKVVSFFGGTKIDFRESRFGTEQTFISVKCCFGGVDIIVPPGVNVDSNIISIFGGVDNRSSAPASLDTPRIKIDGVMVFGGIKIKVKKSKSKRKDKKIKEILKFLSKNYLD